MIYEFKITETSSVRIPVRADNPDEAQKIFDEWYHKHEDELNDGYVGELLDNGYDGRKFTRDTGIDANTYFRMYPLTSFPVMLPEEAPKPVEPKFDMHVRFADGSNTWTCVNRTLGEIGMKLAELSSKYILYSDPDKFNASVPDAIPKIFYIYAVLKDEGETWYEFDDAYGSH